MGGALALELAKRGRARSVVGISPAGGLRPGDEATAQQVIKVFIAHADDHERSRCASLPKVMARPGLRRLALRDVMTRGHQVPGRRGDRARALLGPLRRSSRTSTRSCATARPRCASLDKIDVPVLITWGDKDRILPMETHAPRLREEIRGLEFRVTPGIGHTPMWDDPGLFATTIVDFVARAARATPTQAAGARSASTVAS